MSKYPKPWSIIPVGPDNWCVVDNNECKLFYISADDNPDGKDKPGEHDGPTILGYADDSNELEDEIAETFEAKGEK